MTASASADQAAVGRHHGQGVRTRAVSVSGRPTSPAPVQTTSKKSGGQNGSENASSTFMAVDIFSLAMAACTGV